MFSITFFLYLSLPSCTYSLSSPLYYCSFSVLLAGRFNLYAYVNFCTGHEKRKNRQEQTKISKKRANSSRTVVLLLPVEQADATTKTTHITTNGIDLCCRMAKDKRICQRNQYSSHICIYIYAMPDSRKMNKFWKWWETTCVQCTFYMLPYAHNNNHFRFVLSN